MIELFLRSLKREIKGVYSDLHVLVIDFYATTQERKDWLIRKIGEEEMGQLSVKHVPPKPCVWQGEHKLTKNEYFAASNARNTAFALCPDDFIACVDDLSVLMPGWLDQVRHAYEKRYIVLGAYKKVLNLKCDKRGDVTFDPFPPGVDSRWGSGSDGGIVRAGGSWMFGCSFALPIEWALKVNGSEPLCDGQGAEDTEFGIRLQRAGAKFFYNRNMLTLESEEGHTVPGNQKFIRDKKPMIYNGQTMDSDWVMYHKVTTENRYWTINNRENLSELRDHMLKGGSFPVHAEPTHDWRDGQPLSEM